MNVISRFSRLTSYGRRGFAQNLEAAGKRVFDTGDFMLRAILHEMRYTDMRDALAADDIDMHERYLFLLH